jgi:prepilin-type N-terminal cleavage/methylation domain-containing protein
MSVMKKNGFTLAELLIVAMIGAVVMGAIYAVLITNQRTYTVENVRVRGTQSMRAGMDILFAELREISPAEGDLLGMSGDTILVRVPREFGIVCSVTSSLPSYQVRVAKLSDEGFAVGDSVFILADVDTLQMNDDVWVTARVSAATTGGPCDAALSDSSQTLTLTASGHAGDTVFPGAPIRSFTRYYYGTAYLYYGQYFLSRWEPGGYPEGLVGPLATDGLDFTYYDADGNTTTTAEDVRQIEVKLRVESELRDAMGSQVKDSMTTRIYTRN